MLGNRAQSGGAQRSQIEIASEQDAYVAEVRADAADRLGGGRKHKTLAGLPHDRAGKIVAQVVADGNRPRSRTAGAVRPGERLVHVEVHHVAAEVARPRDAQNGVHVGAVDVHQPADLMDATRDLGDLRLEEADACSDS